MPTQDSAQYRQHQREIALLRARQVKAANQHTGKICPSCGHTDTVVLRPRVMATGKTYHQYHCTHCRAHSTSADLSKQRMDKVALYVGWCLEYNPKTLL